MAQTGGAELTTEIWCDTVGVKLLGVSECDSLARSAMEWAATPDSGRAADLLVGSLQHVTVPPSLKRVAAGRPVLKVAACASDAIRFARDNSGHGVGDFLTAIGSYIGGDSDLAASSTAQRDDNGAAVGDGSALPLPYMIDDGRSPAACDSTLDSECLRHLVGRVLAGRLRLRPVRALMLELVLGNNGLVMEGGFALRLGRLCKLLGVNIVLDETLTFARTHGRTVVSNGVQSLLAVDAMSLQSELSPQFIVSGKVGGIGVVWGRIGESDSLEVGRGTSTSVGQVRLRYANLVMEKLLSLEADAQVTARNRYLSVLGVGAMGQFDHWGSGALVFSSCVPAQARVDRNTPGRMLPTLAIARCEETVPAMSTNPSGVTGSRTARAFAVRVKAALKATPVDAYAILASNALRAIGQKGGKVELRRVLTAGIDDAGRYEAVARSLLTVSKRHSGDDSRMYTVTIPCDILAALRLCES